MNTIDFTQPGGFPFDQGVLDFLQKGSLMAGQPAFFGGPLCIISGCTVSGTSVSSGFVAINGEILPFAGGTITENEKVVIQESVTDITYFDAQARPVKKTRTATFGDDGVTNYLWAHFKRNTTEGVLARLERLERVAAPFLGDRGGMVLWKRPYNTIPDDWAEVLDWRGRLPMGWDGTEEEPAGTLGDVATGFGGNKTHTLLKNQLPKYNIVIPGMTGGDNNDNNVTERFAGGDKSLSQTSFFFDMKVDNGGGDAPFSLLNPYRIVMFIEYIGN